ncbi:MAG: hypothetical protein NTW29_15015 [Bacteroidetes bacterium]|nr:hypothetical protein [Bacteroidota bacterium]
MKQNNPALTLTPHKPGWLRADLGILLLFATVSIYWFYQANYTWDDDAMTRFFNTRRATRQPIMFIDSWNRPLFVVLFYYPVLLFGKAGVAFTMTFLTAVSGYMVGKAAKNLGYPNHQMAIVFMVFQTFLYGITRDAMTEPLAACIISGGLWMFSTRRWLGLAIIGGLLPLARTELIILLPFWCIPLLANRKYLYVLVLGWGLAAWWLGWYIYSGDFMAFFHDLLKSGSKKNRYEHTSVFHHLNKYVYVLGIVVFYFLFLGFLTSRIRMYLQHYFLYLQFIAGFLLYVVFAAYLDLGQSGGALRNLITLSPFAALISLRGLNYWVEAWRLPVADNPAVHTGDKKKGNKKAKEDNGLYRRIIHRSIIIAYSIAIVIIAANVFSQKLVSRQYYDSEEKDYMILLLLILCVVIVILPFFFIAGKRVRVFFFICITGLQVCFTLYYENPYSHKNKERAEMNKMAALMNVPSINKAKVHCNYLWYYWASGRDILDTTKNAFMDSASLKNAPNGSYFLWEPHYTSEHYTNIPLTMLSNDTTFLPLNFVVTEEEELASILFMKWEPVPGSATDAMSELSKDWGENAKFNYFRGVYQRDRLRNFEQALASLNKAIQLDPIMKDAYLHRSVTYYYLHNLAMACTDIQTAIGMHANDALNYGRQMGCVK